MEENRKEEVSQEAVAEETDTAETMEQEAAQQTVSEEEPQEAADSAAEEEAPKKSLFGKKKKDKRDVQIEELTDRVQRQMAEFDNFRKRTEKEKAAMFEVGAKSVIEKLLLTVDNFERGLASVTEEQQEDPFVQGMERVYRQMMTTFEELGVKPIEAVGAEFDPNFHNAVMHVEDEEVDDNIIIEEFLKGYTYKDQVVRHSMVKVAN